VKVDLPTSMIILDDVENAPEYTLPKLAIHTMDSLVKALFYDKKILKEQFYLYEPQNSLLLKVAFKKNAKKTITIAGKKVKADVYTMYMSGKNKKLVNIYVKNVPLKIEAYSKKWDFELIGLGKRHRVEIHKDDVIIKLLKNKIKQQFSSYKMSPIHIKLDNFEYRVRYTIDDEINKKHLKNYINEYARNYSKYAQVAPNDLNGQDTDDYFVYRVKFKDVIKYIEKDKEVDVVDNKYYWKSVKKYILKRKLQEFVSKKTGCKHISDPKKDLKFLCKNNEEVEYDVEDMMAEYIKENKPKYDYKSVDVEDGSTRGEYNIETREKKELSSATLARTAKKLFRKKYDDVKLNQFKLFQNEDKDYIIMVSKNAVGYVACMDKFKSIYKKGSAVSYKDGKCEIKQDYNYPSAKAQKLFDNYLDSNYPDLKFMDVDVMSDRGMVTFQYLDLKELDND